jgi:ATP-dependent Clp protease ATP-binding subunit ClpC
MPHKRLDDNARAIVALANEIAHEYELEYVSTEHILLAILRHNSGVGAKALHNLGIDEMQARDKIDDLVKRSKEDTWVFGRLPGTPHYLNVIERAMDIAEQLEAQSIGSEHLLLALYNEKDCLAAQALAGLGITQKKCRDAVLKTLSAN